MFLLSTSLLQTDFTGKRYLLGLEDPMDTREDYDGFGLVGSDQSAWVYQQIVLPALLALRQPFEVPGHGQTWVRGRPAPGPIAVCFPSSPPPSPPPATLLAPPPPPPSSLLPPPPPPPQPTLPSTTPIEPFARFAPTASSSSSSFSSTSSALPAPPKRDFKSKFGSSLGANYNISSGPLKR
ncbi:hypothetical protein WAI453_010745 [Rhynchosporium graminicola]|uniref:Uncharacterized protein n=1 Tax=Rhynchosporium graminicola TaxID=2792576 RepID=A0A1E1JS47_9HELO|nr:uncharacterized protein RCO7_04387 [Rhynchosporium commune]